MGKHGANMVAREPSSNITMADLSEWWKHIEVEHKVGMRSDWQMSGHDDLAHWRFTVAVWRGEINPMVQPYTVKSLVWPTASHKTVLGAILWLLMGIDDELTASEALTR